jgi:hypothetical protein
VKLFDCDAVPAIQELQWKRMRPLLECEGAVTVDHEALVKVGRVTKPKGLAVLFALQQAGLARLYWHVYHGCSRKPVTSRLIKLGFVPTPWRCPNCKARVDDPNVPLLIAHGLRIFRVGVLSCLLNVPQ